MVVHNLLIRFSLSGWHLGGVRALRFPVIMANSQQQTPQVPSVRMASQRPEGAREIGIEILCKNSWLRRFWVNSGVDWMMPASHILRYGIDPWVLSCISMLLLTLRSLSGSYGAEATLLKVIQKKHVHMIETKKAKETSRSFVALARTQYITNFIKSGEHSLILTPKKHKDIPAVPTVPSPTIRLKRASNWWKYDIGAFDLAFWLICWLLPKSLLLSSGGHWKVRFFHRGCVSPFIKEYIKQIYLPTVNQGFTACPPQPPKVDEFEEGVFWYLAIYIPTLGFCQKTDVSPKS